MIHNGGADAAICKPRLPTTMAQTDDFSPGKLCWLAITAMSAMTLCTMGEVGPIGTRIGRLALHIFGYTLDVLGYFLDVEHRPSDLEQLARCRHLRAVPNSL